MKAMPSSKDNAATGKEHELAGAMSFHLCFFNSVVESFNLI